MRVGDKVRHVSRPDVGVGVVFEVAKDGTCSVNFKGTAFSGVQADAFVVVPDPSAVQYGAKASEQVKAPNPGCSVTAKDTSNVDQVAANEMLIKNRQRERRIAAAFSRYQRHSLWHLTHRDNVRSILNRGILNNYEATSLRTSFIDISDPGAQRWREQFDPIYKRRIHEYAPLYIEQRNPMLYVRRHMQEELCLIEISLAVLAESEWLLTDGNAASRGTNFSSLIDDIDNLPWEVLNAHSWNLFPDGKRQRCAEVLIYPKIPPQFINRIHCYSRTTANLLSRHVHLLLISPDLFFWY